MRLGSRISVFLRTVNCQAARYMLAVGWRCGDLYDDCQVWDVIQCHTVSYLTLLEDDNKPNEVNGPPG